MRHVTPEREFFARLVHFDDEDDDAQIVIRTRRRIRSLVSLTLLVHERDAHVLPNGQAQRVFLRRQRKRQSQRIRRDLLSLRQRERHVAPIRRQRRHLLLVFILLSPRIRS